MFSSPLLFLHNCDAGDFNVGGLRQLQKVRSSRCLAPHQGTSTVDRAVASDDQAVEPSHLNHLVKRLGRAGVHSQGAVNLEGKQKQKDKNTINTVRSTWALPVERLSAEVANLAPADLFDMMDGLK